MSRKLALRIVLALALAVGIVLLAGLPFERVLGGFDSLIREMRQYGLAGSLVMMLLAALSAFPAELVAMANGAMYGPIGGVALTWASGMVGASVAFLIGRLLGPSVVRRLVGKKRYATLTDYAQGQFGFASLLVLRLVPLVPFFLLNYAAGLAGMRYWAFCLATGLGIVPVVVLSSVVGSSVMDKNWEFLIWLGALLAAFLFFLWVVRRRIKSRSARAARRSEQQEG